MDEEWRPVTGYAGLYEVSDLGRVRSFHTGTAHLLRPGRSSNGYLTVCLQLNGDRYSFPVQWLVAEAFIGPRPMNHEVCHYDNNRRNNIPGNLYYGTSKQNAADQIRHGTRLRGSQKRLAKLTEKTVREIKPLLYKISQSALAERYNVSPAAIQAIADGRTWRHVE